MKDRCVNVVAEDFEGAFEVTQSNRTCDWDCDESEQYTNFLSWDEPRHPQEDTSIILTRLRRPWVLEITGTVVKGYMVKEHGTEREAELLKLDDDFYQLMIGRSPF